MNNEQSPAFAISTGRDLSFVPSPGATHSYYLATRVKGPGAGGWPPASERLQRRHRASR